MGNAFDVTAERVTKSSRKITDRVREEDYEVTLRNHKDEDIVVRVVDHFFGYWTITQTNREHVKKDAYRVEFEVPVARDGESVIGYTVRYEY